MGVADTRRIWLCADDYGMAPGVNTAIRELIQQRRLNATSVMTAAPHLDADEVAALDALNSGETRAAHHHVKVVDPAWHFLYGPFARGTVRLAALLNRFQFLTVRRYLTLVFATLIILLLVVAAWR